MRILALDPSYKNTGVVFMDGTCIRLFSVGEATPRKDFTHLYWAAMHTVKQIVHELKLNTLDPRSIILVSEIPPHLGEFAAGLYMLDTLLLTYLMDYCREVYVLNPNFLPKIHGKRKFRKGESVELMQMLRQEFSGYTFIPDKKVYRSDICEAFLMFLRIYIKRDVNREICQRVVQINNKFLEREEALFWSVELEKESSQ